MRSNKAEIADAHLEEMDETIDSPSYLTEGLKVLQQKYIENPDEVIRLAHKLNVKNEDDRSIAFLTHLIRREEELIQDTY